MADVATIRSLKVVTHCSPGQNITCQTVTRENVQLVSPSRGMCFQGDKTSIQVYWLCGAFCVSDDRMGRQSLKPTAQPLMRLWTGRFAGHWCSPQGGGASEGGLERSLLPLWHQGKVQCRVRPTTPGNLHALATSETTLKKYQNQLKMPRPHSSLWKPSCSQEKWKLLQSDTTSFCPQRSPTCSIQQLFWEHISACHVVLTHTHPQQQLAAHMNLTKNSNSMQTMYPLITEVRDLWAIPCLLW